MLFLVHVIFGQFLTELWPLIDIRILFMFNILWNNLWILIKFCICIDIDKVDLDDRTIFFVHFQQSYGPWLMSEFCFHLISWEQIDGFWWNFVYAVLWLAHEIFLNFSTELWPLIGVKISIFRNNEWILIRFCLCIDIWSMLWLIHIIFPNFSTKLWPLIDFRLMFMLNILWNN